VATIYLIVSCGALRNALLVTVTKELEGPILRVTKGAHPRPAIFTGF